MPQTEKTNVATPEGTKVAPAPQPFTAMFVIAPAVGWLVPGLGHVIQKRWIRGLLIAASVCTLFFLGLAMQGKVYSANTGDILDMLGFIGDIGAGGLYIVTKAVDAGQGAIHRAVADYGTKYIIAAGLLNIISAIDAYHIASGKKQ
ncbi:MAG TPA: DUF6677 family protein [Terriglobales bacterium]|nr:DUF6677 family protein [Terriglobales bacterium]